MTAQTLGMGRPYLNGQELLRKTIPATGWVARAFFSRSWANLLNDFTTKSTSSTMTFLRDAGFSFPDASITRRRSAVPIMILAFVSVVPGCSPPSPGGRAMHTGRARGEGARPFHDLGAQDAVWHHDQIAGLN